MRLNDRLGRTLDEDLGHYEVIQEEDFDRYTSSERPDEALWMMRRLNGRLHLFDDNLHTRRVVAVSPDPQHCIMGVHFLVRDKLYGFAWFRASAESKRANDVASIIYAAKCVRSYVDNDLEIELRLFSSTYHWEVDRP